MISRSINYEPSKSRGIKKVCTSESCTSISRYI